MKRLLFFMLMCHYGASCFAGGSDTEGKKRPSTPDLIKAHKLKPPSFSQSNHPQPPSPQPLRPDPSPTHPLEFPIIQEPSQPNLLELVQKDLLELQEETAKNIAMVWGTLQNLFGSSTK